MPNIEIHGLDLNVACQLQGKIFGIFADTSYVNEMVITIFATIVLDRNNTPQPFLRLVNSRSDSTEILKRLKSLGFDIEYLRLEEFFPKNVSDKLK